MVSLFHLLYFASALLISASDIPKPLIFAHWMPWFQYPQNAYHWPPIGGTYYIPLIGYYNSQNDSVIDWQLSLMQYVGIDGIIVDWYGTSQKNDYPFIKDSTDLIWSKIQSKYPNFKLAICYDLNSGADMDTFDESLLYLNESYFSKTQYLTYTDGSPIMLLWPSDSSDSTLQTPKGLMDELNKLNMSTLNVFMEFRNSAFQFNAAHNNSYSNLGVFNWIYPQNKASDEQTQIDQVVHDTDYYYSTAGGGFYNSQFYVGSIFKGFSDHYVDGGIGTTNPYNDIGFIDADYNYLSILFDQNLSNNTMKKYPFLLQIPTWNDYTEGTMIEPNIPSIGCVKGCNDDTLYNAYSDLVTLYKSLINDTKSNEQIQRELEEITSTHFPNL